MKFRVSCIQVNPQIGQIENNIKQVKNLINKLINHPLYKSIDLIILPELALTGYNFKSPQHIKPYLETIDEEGGDDNDRKGPSYKLASNISTQLNCFTVIGYPELSKGKIFNSCLLMGPNGKLIYNYRKTHLYETDETWGCNENPDKSFKSIKLIIDKEYYSNNRDLSNTNKVWNTVTTNFGICMDLNPYQFKAPFNSFEMSMSCFNNNAKLILCPTAWLSPKSPSINENLSNIEKLNKAEEFREYFNDNEEQLNMEQQKNNEVQKINENSDDKFNIRIPDKSTYNYWILRFFPFLKHPMVQIPAKNFKTNLIMCNRIGIEDDIIYGGSSSIFTFNGNDKGNEEIDETNSSVENLGNLGMGINGVLYREIELDLD